jgi:hypothetical protein
MPFLRCRQHRVPPGLVSIHSMRLEIFQIAKRQACLVRSREYDLRCMPRVERFLPTRRAEAPSVAGLQTRKSELQVRRREIVADRLGKRQKIGRHYHAHRVRANVLGARVAAAVAEKAGHRRRAADRELTSQHIFRVRQPDYAVCRGNSNHNGPCLSSRNRPRNHRPRPGFGRMSDKLFQLWPPSLGEPAGPSL